MIGFGLDLDWIWIGLSIHFEKWIWTWIDNHIFVMDLEWIDNPKKLDWAIPWKCFIDNGYGWVASLSKGWTINQSLHNKGVLAFSSISFHPRFFHLQFSKAAKESLILREEWSSIDEAKNGSTRCFKLTSSHNNGQLAREFMHVKWAAIFLLLCLMYCFGE